MYRYIDPLPPPIVWRHHDADCHVGLLLMGNDNFAGALPAGRPEMTALGVVYGRKFFQKATASFVTLAS